ncbi:tetratricopeptide repeat protein [Streptomyces sp. KK5PA1]|uniref:Tetratricopeptide repeat protein n=1 Tax=Actinacidiphila acididurans TaxID=2784346 RepID=A0ABS2TK05_9ACTN|nr:tetratricopeptide repeat protein [Actinacidiphila acididurans]
MELRILGPLEIWYQGRAWKLGTPKERGVLAALAASAGESVSVQTLADRIWAGAPPRSAVATLHSYLSRLRKHLKNTVGDQMRLERPTTRTYRLSVAPEAVDLLRFRRLRDQARTAARQGDPEQAVDLLRAAEALWRAEPLAEFSGEWFDALRERLREDLRSTRNERIRYELGLGRHADLIGELRALVDEDPLAQSTVADLMLALYRAGRHSQSLALYQSTRRHLDEELGLDPGPELSRLHQLVLAQDPALDLPVTGPGAGAGAWPPAGPWSPPAPAVRTGPRNFLPRDNRDFTGRDDELRDLLARPEPDSTALPVTVVHGMPGVGKSTLVIHAAHRLRDDYPDGVFYVDLRAHREQPPCEPGEALAALLNQAGQPVATDAAATAQSHDALAAQWRDWLSDRRALLVLDDAHDAEQVRPLLPGSATCRVFVTSRHRLAHLGGAGSVELEVMSGSEAAALFTRIVTAARVSDAAALDRVVDICGHLPLAVQITAHRFRHRDSWDQDVLIDRLTQAADVLEELDLEPGIATAFQLSYSQLGPAERFLFRRLALHPGPDLTLQAVTVLTGFGTAQARRGIEELLDTHLLEEPLAGRYRFHALVRAFAVRVSAGAEEPQAARQSAVRRLLTHYLTAADRADRLAHAERRRIEIGAGRWEPEGVPFPGGPADSPAFSPAFADAAEASAWLDVERANLLAAAHEAAVTSPEHAALFPHVLAPSFKRWGAHAAALELQSTALAALRAGHDSSALALTLVERAEFLCHEDHEEALRCAREALALFCDLADVRGQADALVEVGRAELSASRRSASLAHLDEALALYRLIGHRHGEVKTLNVQAVLLHFAGELAEARRRFGVMLEIAQSLEDLYWQATALMNTGELDLLEKNYERAQDYLERSLALARRTGDRQLLAHVHTNLGNLCRATGRTDEALAQFRTALNSYRAAHDLRSEANTLLSMGTTYRETGRHSEAMHHFTMAEELARAVANPYEQQSALLGIGTTQWISGQPTAALATLHEALRLAEEIEIPLGMAHALDGISQILLRTTGPAAAKQYAQRALLLYRSLGVQEDVERVGRQLAEC